MAANDVYLRPDAGDSVNGVRLRIDAADSIGTVELTGVGGIASAESVNDVTASLTGSAGNIATAESVNAVVASLTGLAGNIVTAESVNAAVASLDGIAGNIVSAENVSSESVSLTVLAGDIVSAESVNSPTTSTGGSITLTGVGDIASTEGVGIPDVGPYTLDYGTSYTIPLIIRAPKRLTIVAGGIESEEFVETPTLTLGRFTGRALRQRREDESLLLRAA